MISDMMILRHLNQIDIHPGFPSWKTRQVITAHAETEMYDCKRAALDIHFPEIWITEWRKTLSMKTLKYYKSQKEGKSEKFDLICFQ